METRNNTLLLFSKLPEAGLVKTRLSELKDGLFSAELAKDIYEAMLLDVCEIILNAFSILEGERSDAASSIGNIQDSYCLVVSTAPKQNVAPMQALLRERLSGIEGSERIKVIYDEGASFDEHYNDAFEKCFQEGADCILSMGADMPSLREADVIGGFQALHGLYDSETKGIVISPDQEMGVSMIGWNKDTPFDHTGVFYNRDGLTVLPAYIRKVQSLDLCARYIPAVVDVDTMSDLYHNATLIEALKYCSQFSDATYAKRTFGILEEYGLDDIRIAPNDLFDPRDAIDR